MCAIIDQSGMSLVEYMNDVRTSQWASRAELAAAAEILCTSFLLKNGKVQEDGERTNLLHGAPGTQALLGSLHA